MYKNQIISLFLLALLTAFGCGPSTGPKDPTGSAAPAAPPSSPPPSSPPPSPPEVIYKWTESTLPGVVKPGDVEELYMSGDKKNFYLKTAKALYHRGKAAGPWAAVELTGKAPFTGAETVNPTTKDKIWAVWGPTNTGLLITAGKKGATKKTVLLIVDGAIAKWAINTHAHNSTSKRKDKIDGLGEGTTIEPIGLVQKNGEEYFRFAESFIHKTGGDFDEAPTKAEGKGTAGKATVAVAPFDKSSIDMRAKNEIKAADGSALLALSDPTPALGNAYDIGDDEVMVFVKDKGIFIRKKTTGSPKP